MHVFHFTEIFDTVSGPDRWRIGPLLDRWWTAGWCPAGLLHAIDHYPNTRDRLGTSFHGCDSAELPYRSRCTPNTGRSVPRRFARRRGQGRLAAAMNLATASLGSPERTSASPTSTTSAPQEWYSATCSGPATPDSATRTRPAGMSGASLA
jgi:hypothetical protein